MTRPACDHCGGPVPESMWTAADEAGELDYNRRTNTPHRPVYDSMRCFRIVRDHRCGQVHDAAHQRLDCGTDHTRTKEVAE